jgi:hypothetical protein
MKRVKDVKGEDFLKTIYQGISAASTIHRTDSETESSTVVLTRKK